MSYRPSGPSLALAPCHEVERPIRFLLIPSPQQHAPEIARPADPARLSRWLGDLPTATPLVIDFSRVDELQDVGVAAVAPELANHSGVALRGLGRHHLRLLRYCGLELPLGRRDALGSADE